MGQSHRFLIYALTDPRTSQVRYIGKSSTGLKRARSHGRPTLLERDDTHKARWIKQLLVDGMHYGVTVLEEIPHVDALPSAAQRHALNAAEIRWIAHGRAEGWPLTNLTAGGDGGADPSPETRAKMSAASKGRPKSPEMRAKISAAKKGIPRSEETKAKLRSHSPSPEHREAISRAITGRKWTEERRVKQSQIVVSEETRKKHRVQMTGLHRGPEFSAVMSAARKGVPIKASAYSTSPENLALLRSLHDMRRGKPDLKLRGRPKSEEHKAKIKAALIGKKRTPEQCLRIREAQQRLAAERRAAKER